jgi:hypothetical protein
MPQNLANELAHGQSTWIGSHQVRNFHGFLQSREGGKGAWQFQVTGLGPESTGQAGWCNVLEIGGDAKRVSIDEQDRICIKGRRYGRARWNH